MTERAVAGVAIDQSKEAQHQTWMVLGQLGPLGLEILDVQKTGSHALGAELAKHKALKAVGVAGAFSLPVSFLSFMAQKGLRKDYQSWQEIVEDLVFMTYEHFCELVQEFKKSDAKKEAKRITDSNLGSQAAGPVAKASSALTYQTMRLLASLDPKFFYVVPFQDAIALGCSVIEIYVPDTVKFFGIKNDVLTSLEEIREHKGITYKDCPRLVIPKRLRHHFTASDDALNALVSCYTTGLYLSNPDLFEDPFSQDSTDVLLEGWMYRPRFAK